MTRIPARDLSGAHIGSVVTAANVAGDLQIVTHRARLTTLLITSDDGDRHVHLDPSDLVDVAGGDGQ